MSMNETLLVTLCGSSVLVAVISLVGNVINFRMNRKAKLEDEDRADNDKIGEIDERVTKLEEIVKKEETDVTAALREISSAIADLKDSQKIILYDRILSLSQSYIVDQKITFSQKKDLHNMHSIYHNRLGGNGDLDQVMKDVDALKVDYNGDGNGDN